MAYVKKYWAKFENTMGTRVNYLLELLKEGAATGHTEIEHYAPSPFELRSVQASRDADPVVIGSETVFRFITRTPDTYDDLFESEYRDWRLDLYNDDTSTLIWRGYVQPENMQRDLLELNTLIELSATDAIKDLSSIDLDDSGLADEAKVIDVITEALSPIDIPLDYYVKLNTYETRNSADELCLDNTYVDKRRFTLDNDGREKIDTCLTAIEKILKPFMVRLRQSLGKYYIQATTEINSRYYDIIGTAVTGPTAATDSVLIDDARLQKGATLSKITPVKYLDVTHFNRNMGEDLVADLDNFLATGTPWDFTDMSYVVTEDDGTLKIEVAEVEAGTKRFFIDVPIEITVFSPLDFFQLEFEHTWNNEAYVGDGFTVVNINVLIEKEDPPGTWTEYRRENVAIRLMDENLWMQWGTTFNQFSQITETGTYRFAFEVFADSTFGGAFTMDVFLRNFMVNKLTTIEGDQVATLTFDKVLRYTSALGKRLEEKEIWFGDSFGSGDLGRYIVNIGGDMLSSQYWNRYGKVDTLPIIDIYAQSYLNRRADYTDVIDISVYDFDNEIWPHNIIQIDTTYYLINTYQRDFRTTLVRMQLEEIRRNV